MDITVDNRDECIRKIEDIIDLQKANGNLTTRQVAFNLPSETESNTSASLAKSLETGLSRTKSDEPEKKQLKKGRSKRHKSPIADAISWPSDSDITVLRMKLCLSSDIKEKVGSMIPGDGLHHPDDDSSMVNLATLMRQPQPASKLSINIEEYLLPLSSWETDQESENKNQLTEDNRSQNFTQFSREIGVFGAMCRERDDSIFFNDSSIQSETSKKSKIAKFLRLYFCPCCTCLYRMENMKSGEEHSVYQTKPVD